MGWHSILVAKPIGPLDGLSRGQAAPAPCGAVAGEGADDGSAAWAGGRRDGQGHEGARELSHRSVAYVRDVLRVALGFGVRREWVGRNVASGDYIEPPRWEKREVNPA